MDTEGPTLSSPRVLRDLLTRHGIHLKKQYGQNFLIDGHVLEAIVDASGVSAADGVLEVGPGAGVVTEHLAQRARYVMAVEKDTSLQPLLEETLAGYSNVEVVYDDFLRVDLSALWEKFAAAECTQVAVVANLPYYITTPILFRLFDAGVPWSRMVVMVQREVAQRISAPPGGKEYGALTVAVQFRAQVRTVLRVRPSAFFPAPEVESSVLCLERLPSPAVDVLDEVAFFRVVRGAFATRRKTLTNALVAALAMPKSDVLQLLESAGVDGGRRGETLTLQEFAQISNTLVQLT